VSADPLAVHSAKADLNVYAYVAGKVLSAVDPVGLDPKPIVRVNTAPSGVQRGQYFFLRPDRQNEVKTFNSLTDLRAAAEGAPTFQYDPGAKVSLKDAADIMQAADNLRRLMEDQDRGVDTTKEGGGCVGIECSGHGKVKNDDIGTQLNLAAAFALGAPPDKEASDGGVAGGGFGTNKVTSVAAKVAIGIAVLAASFLVGKGIGKLFKMLAPGRAGASVEANILRNSVDDELAAVAGGEAADAARKLPRSGPIPRSVGAMSRAERIARKFGLNAESAPTRQVLNSLDDTVESFVGQFRRGKIRRELPGEVMGMTVEEALGHSSKVRKLLSDGRFAK
jgi:hypothetical protein